MPQRLDRIELSRTACWEIAEDDAHQCGECERLKNDRPVDTEGYLHRTRGKPCKPQAENNANQAAEQGKNDRLDQELGQYLPLKGGTYRPDLQRCGLFGFGARLSCGDARRFGRGTGRP